MAPPTRVAVFRALQLGDVLTALPALRALRTCFPAAHLTFIGQPWAAQLLPRVDWMDAFLAFPGHPQLPEQSYDEGALHRFHAQARAARFDLAVQMHGSGSVTNAIVAALGAPALAGFHLKGAPCPDPARFVAWPDHGREVERLARLPLHLGARRFSLRPRLTLLDADHAGLDALWPAHRDKPYACIHPGARFPSRRWPVERFAAVAHTLSESGLTLALTGSAAEEDTLEAFRRLAPPQAVDLSGRTRLGTLAALVAGARVLVSNDTGVSHVAAAVGTPSVIISSGGDAQRWSPVDGERHRVLAHAVACRPCEHERCPTQHECARGVPVAAVLNQLSALLSRPLREEKSQHAA